MAEKIKIPRFSAEEINNLVEGMAEMISQQSRARRVKVVPQKVVDETTEKLSLLIPFWRKFTGMTFVSTMNL